MADTIIILGAGASMPYGFPSGEELKKQIQEELADLIRELPLQQPKTGTLSGILKMGSVFEVSLCKEFLEALVRSGVYSIDAFLERRPKFRELGKNIIAYLLLKSEKKCIDENTLFLPKNPEENWYRYFFNEIKDITQFNFKIYTYNYERSLEYFFIEAYRNLFDYSSELIFERIKDMNIIHLHGSLGPIDTVGKVNSPNFGNTSMISNYSNLTNLSQGIEIIYEVEGSKLERLRNDINVASQIVFIGFGFDQINMKNIGLDTLSFPKQEDPIFYASTFGLYANEVQNRFLKHLKFYEPQFERKIGIVNPYAMMNDPVVTASQTAAFFLRDTLPHSVYTD